MIVDDPNIQDLMDEQGWTDDTVGQLALNFIKENGDISHFRRYLEEVQAEESGGPETDYQPTIIGVGFNVNDVTGTFDVDDTEATKFLEEHHDHIEERLVMIGNEVIEQLADEAGLKRYGDEDDA